MIDLLGAPFDLCGFRLGSRLGPAGLRLAHLSDTLSQLGLSVQDLGDVFPMVGSEREFTAPGGLKNFRPLCDCIAQLRAAVDESLAQSHLPIVMGGDHTLAIGGIAAALARYGPDLAVLWIDAHADLNTPGSSSTGNVHGMPLAALAGLPSETQGVQDQEWQLLQTVLGDGPRLNLSRTAWYGLRDVDPPERDRLTGHAISMHDIDRHGVDRTVRSVDFWLRRVQAKHVWLSFDVDSLDPILAPGTGTAVRGGLSYREGHLMAELLREALDAFDCPYHLVGLDIVEVNPIIDAQNQTAVLTVEWMASLFGKTILGTR